MTMQKIRNDKKMMKQEMKYKTMTGLKFNKNKRNEIKQHMMIIFVAEEDMAHY